MSVKKLLFAHCFYLKRSVQIEHHIAKHVA